MKTIIVSLLRSASWINVLFIAVFSIACAIRSDAPADKDNPIWTPMSAIVDPFSVKEFNNYFVKTLGYIPNKFSHNVPFYIDERHAIAGDISSYLLLAGIDNNLKVIEDCSESDVYVVGRVSIIDREVTIRDVVRIEKVTGTGSIEICYSRD